MIFLCDLSLSPTHSLSLSFPLSLSFSLSLRFYLFSLQKYIFLQMCTWLCVKEEICVYMHEYTCENVWVWRYWNACVCILFMLFIVPSWARANWKKLFQLMLPPSINNKLSIINYQLSIINYLKKWTLWNFDDCQKPKC